ncbi:Crp/Fnr family transcriptional regulator [Pontimicrobium sp. IMCC45349]|jgi:CRP-like cAMP-binding protein|uniref:Crp/Fnr family transcriptional regulator n=1 Tax=Pontimicrobium sp. IMCC45349 TaxID=3391574 RepID=UPI0039A1965A
MNRNFKFLNSFVNISEADFLKLQKISSFRRLKKKETIAIQGEFPVREIFLLVSGVMRAYVNAESGKQFNKKIFVPTSFVGPLTSLVKNSISGLTYEALTDCKVYSINYDDFVALCKRDIIISNLYSKILEFVFIQYEKRSIELMAMDATERYLKLKERIPNIDDLIPQFQIASYLSITPVQLSRIRKKLL